MLERFIRDDAGSRAVPRRAYRRRLARLWSHAGRQCLNAGDVTAGRECLKRAVGWQWTYYRAWSRLTKSYLRAAA